MKREALDVLNTVSKGFTSRQNGFIQKSKLFVVSNRTLFAKTSAIIKFSKLFGFHISTGENLTCN
jgi:hypothetical protein